MSELDAAEEREEARRREEEKVRKAQESEKKRQDDLLKQKHDEDVLQSVFLKSARSLERYSISTLRTARRESKSVSQTTKLSE